MKRTARGSCYGYGHSFGYGGHNQQDRLTSLSDDLLICILSYVDTKLAVQSSVLSKRWVNLWTLVPVLNFNRSDYVFVRNVLARRNASIMIDRLSIKVFDYDTMARVFNDAIALNVSDLSIDVSENVNKYHLITFDDDNSSNLLTKLSLKGMLDFGCFPSFDGLVSLRLERVKIVECEPFSGFPNLGELFLINCKMEFGLGDLEVVADRLWRLTISSCFHTPVAYLGLMLLTPKLLLFELEGLIPMAFEGFEDLCVLHTVHIDCLYSYTAQQVLFDQQQLNLIKIIGSFKHAKCVHLSPSTVELLSLCESMIGEEHCPFEDLKFLNLIPPPNKPVPQLDFCVAEYLLKNCPRAIVQAWPRSVGMAFRPSKFTRPYSKGL